jgi:hypothetical protein
VDDDSASIRSFVPTVSGGEDLEAMLSEMLGTEARWRLAQDDDIDVWEGHSDGESDTDEDYNEDPQDDGWTGSGLADDRGQDDSMALETETFLCAVFCGKTNLFSIW